MTITGHCMYLIWATFSFYLDKIYIFCEKFSIWTDTLKKNYPPHSHAFISYTASTPTNNGAENLKNVFLLFRLVAFVVHALIEKCLSTKVKGSKKVGSTYFRSGNYNPDDGNCPCSQHLKLSVTDWNTGSNIVSDITSLPINLSSDDGEANTCIFNV